MPLSSANIVTGNVIQALDVSQFYSLLTGAMTDQAVTLKNQLTVGGSQAIGAVPVTIQGVNGQTADFLDVTAFGGSVGGIFKISSSGAITFGSGITVTSGGINVTGASTFASGGLTVQAGGLVITAGGLQVSAGNAGFGSAPAVNAIVTASSSVNASGGTAIGINSAPTLVAQANNDSLYGFLMQGTAVFNPNSKTGVTAFGMRLGAVTGANQTNIGLQIDAPTGATTNIGIVSAGVLHVLGSGNTPLSTLHLNDSRGGGIAFPANSGVGFANNAGMLYIQDSGSGAGAGGIVVFGANQGWFAAIKGFLQNGSPNTVGDLAFATRNAIADTSLTERLRIQAGGNIIVASGSKVLIGTSPAQGQLLGLPNSASIAFRNAANTGDVTLGVQNTDQWTLTTGSGNVVAAGGAVVSDLLIQINGTQYRVALKQ